MKYISALSIGLLVVAAVLVNSGNADDSTDLVNDSTTTVPTVPPNPVTDSSTTADPTTTALPSEQTDPTTVAEPQSTPPVETTVQVITETSTTPTTDPPPDSNVTKAETVAKLSQQIRAILKHFQNVEPTGFPGQTVLEDPLSVPDSNTSISIFTGDFYNTTVHGLSNFTLDSVNTVLDQLEVYTMIKMRRVYIMGNCTIDSDFGLKSQGPFNITLTNVTAEATVFLEVQSDGSLVANKSLSEMTYEDLIFTTASGGLLQTALSGAGAAILSTLKPYILKQIDERITQEINKHLQKAPKFPAITDKSPVDLAIIEGRKYVAGNYEPFVIQKIIEHDSQFLSVNVGPVTIRGLSKFSRVGSVTLKMVNGTVVIGLRLITGRLLGSCKFFYDFGKIGTPRDGLAYFTVSHVQFEAKVNQSTDLRKKPILDDLQLETGKISVQLDGNGKLDYVLQLAMKLLPQMLRHLIVDAMEEPIRQKIQEEIFNKLNVEEIVESQLPLVESLMYKFL